MLELNIEAVVLIKDRPSEKLRGGGGGAGKVHVYGYQKNNINARENWNKENVNKKYLCWSKYPHPSHNFSNVPSYPITKRNFKKQWLVNELGPREGMSLRFQVAG